MRIGELAERAGVSVRALRYYEEKGLLTSTRSTSGQRHYGDEHVDRVRWIQGLYAGGLSSTSIAESLPCTEDPSREHSDAALETLLGQRADIDARLTELQATRDRLDVLVEQLLAHRATLP